MIKYEGIVSVIPAFKTKTNILNENIRYIGNYPLIAYSIFTSRASHLIDKTIVCTDDKEISLKAFEYGATVLFMESRIGKLEFNSDLEWIYLFLHRYKENYGKYPKILAILRPTSPLRFVSEVEKGIMALGDTFTSVRSVEALNEDLERNYKLNKRGELVPAFPKLKLEDIHNTRNSFTTSFRSNEYIDVLRSEIIVKSKELYGKSICGFITPHIIQVKTLEDISLLQDLLLKREEGVI
jgi:CMP-N-acetylneuraminic acid synthetase